MKSDKEMLQEIKNLRAKKTTIWCDWEDKVDWLISKVESGGPVVLEKDLEGEYSLILARNNVLVDKIESAKKALA